MSEAPQEGIAVVLIAGAQSSISESLTARISQALTDAGFSGQAWRSLKDRHAYDAIIRDQVWSPATASEITGRCRDVIGEIPIDVGVVDIVDRRKKVLIADMDSTIIEQECLDELAGYAGLKDEIASVTEQAMRGELNFEDALRARVAKLKGLPAEKLSDTLEDKVSIMPGAKTLVATMRAHGATTVLASGGFTYFTKRVADRVGFDQNIGNQLDIEDERLTGTVKEPIFGRDGKAETLRRVCRDLGVSTNEAIAVGDGANDLGMIDVAGLGVAYRAKPAVAQAAGVSIQYSDLTALLYLQGYTESDLE